MELDVTATTRIERSPEAVAAYQFDATRDPTWIGGVDTVELETPPPIGVGSRVVRRGKFMGRGLEWLMEVRELIPARLMDLHALRSPFPMDVTYSLDPSGTGTQASIRIRGSASGMYALMGPLTPWMVRRSVQADLGRLKRAVESGG